MRSRTETCVYNAFWSGIMGNRNGPALARDFKRAFPGP